MKVQIAPSEWRWAAIWSGLLLLLSLVPFLIAGQAAPDGWQFTGILVNPYDGQSYLAKMQQGVAGNWLFHLTYTSEPHDGSFIFTFYIALGHLAAITGWSKVAVFHAARLLAGLVLLLLVFRFIARIIPQPPDRRLAFALILTASGFGWLGVLFDAFPIDLWVPEAFVPYSIYANPHFPLGMALMVFIFEQALITGPRSFKSTIWAGLAALALAMILPFALLVVWAVLIAFLLQQVITSDRRLPWAQTRLTLTVGLVSAPMILYQFWVSTTNPILAGWGMQNVTAAPPLFDFWLGYGLIGLLALIGIVTTIRDRTRSTAGEWLVLIWALMTIVLVYFPFDLQRRLITGLHIPLCILAALGLSRWLAGSRLGAGYQGLIKRGVIAIGLVGTMFVWSLPLIGALQSPAESDTAALLFIRHSEVEALTWLQNQVEQNHVIFSSARMGLFVPGRTGARAFYGHPFETIEAESKKAKSNSFFRGQSTEGIQAADFIIYGPSEQALGRPDALTGFTIVYSNDSVTIYQTKTP